MLSQIHPIEVPDADPPSDLRQVQKWEKNNMKEMLYLTLIYGSPGVPDSGQQPTALLPG